MAARAFTEQYHAENGSQNFKGLIDEVKMYDYAIDHEKITRAYADENPYGNCACLQSAESDRDGRFVKKENHFAIFVYQLP